MNQTNEEKILDILAEMSLRMNSMEQGLNARMNSMAQGLNARMDSMEQGLNARMDSIENTVLKTNIRIETEIIPKLDALGEGHAAILEQLVPVSRVDELESRVRFLETMLRSVCEEMQTLKTAQ